MPARTWLVLSLSICFCEFPCSAQRSNPSGSHGSFGREPVMTRMNRGGQFRPSVGYRPFVRLSSPYGPRVSQPMRSRGNSRERPEFNSTAQKAISRSSFSTREPDRLSGLDVAPRFGSGSESPDAFARERTMGSSSPMVRQRIQQPTRRAGVSVPRPPSRLPRGDSPVPRPPFRFQGMTPFVLRPPLWSVAIDGNSRFANIPQLVVSRSRVLLSSRLFFSSPFLSNPFFSPRPFFFSPFFSNPFFFPQPFFFSPFFSNGFFFPQPFLFTPFFFNPFFFNPFFFSQPFFFSLSFSNAFFFPQPLFFSPFFSNPFFFQRPFLFSPLSSSAFFFQRPFHLHP